MTIQPRQQQRGITLVELMVALMLGLLITGGVVQVFSASRVNYGFNEGLARLQENGRFALDTLGHDIRLAGHFGCSREVTMTDRVVRREGLALEFSRGLEGFEAAAEDRSRPGFADDWSPALPDELWHRAVPGSDVLVVRYGSVSGHALVPPYTTDDSVFAAAGKGDYDAGDLVIVADCDRASVFRVAAVSPHRGGIRLERAPAGRPPHSAASRWPGPQYSDGAELRRAETRVYYVGKSADGGIPALYRQRLVADRATATSALVADELVEGVDTMQVLYGIDQARDGAVDRYVTADAVADWDRVVTVRIALVMRSPAPVGTGIADRRLDVNGTIFEPADDRHARQVFTTTIALRNRLP